MEPLGVPAAIIGLVEALKQIGMPARLAPWISIALGGIAWLLVGPAGQDVFLKVLEGAGLGAIAPAVVFLAGRFRPATP